MLEDAWNAAARTALRASIPCALLDSVLVGGNHLALLIGADHPSYSASFDEAMEHYYCVVQEPDLYEVWCCWRAIMLLRDAARAAMQGDKP
jgi:hypothetical protein